ARETRAGAKRGCLKQLCATTILKNAVTIAGTKIELTPMSSTLGGITMTGCLASHCGGGVVIQNSGISWQQNPIWRKTNLIEKTEHHNVIKVNFGKK
ncbi:hypothetical protein, partial [Aeromonas allosaccharophila]|uniref:hypothetical protein n=1 Tax=Aeromonas allosaccharophila TaxID=656 RepID=UPI003D2522E9